MSISSTSAPRPRVLLIGLDSADAELVESWMAAGEMPNFARLRERGSFNRLGTSAEVMHVSAWPTLYTGTTPGHHGMYHAYQIRAGEQDIHRTEPDRCGQPPFWKALDDAGRKCIVFDAFMDYPLPGFKGKQILEYGTWTWFGEPGSTPAGLLDEIKRRFGPYPAPEHTSQLCVPDDCAGFRDQLVAGARLKSRIVQALMKENEWDFMFVTFGEPHGAGHYLWHIGDRDFPLHPGQGPSAGTHPILDVYRAVDQAIGEIIDVVDDRTTVLVTSGDGMGPNYSGCHLMPDMLHRMGLYHAGNVGGGGPAAAKPKKGLLSTIRQAIPLGWRQSVTRCLPRSMRYKLSMMWTNSGIDWAQSRVFCIPNSNEAYFRINLSGREPKGNVKPGGEYEDLVGRLKTELHGLTQPKNGVTAIERVTIMDEVYPGPRRSDLPDIATSWNLQARILDEIATPSAGLIHKQPGYMVSPFYTGNHRANAFVLTAGGDARVSTANGHILDIAPTVLSLLGVDAPSNFEGRSWLS